jgi:hypothetical protein
MPECSTCQGLSAVTITCPYCNGDGEVTEPCPDCSPPDPSSEEGTQEEKGEKKDD